MYKLKKYTKDILYGLKIIWQVSKVHFILRLILSLLLSLIPFVTLFLWRELINGLVEFISGKGDKLISTIIFFTVGYCIVMLIEKFLQTIQNIVTYKYNDAINYHLENIMINKVAYIDIAFFDSNEMNNMLENSYSWVYSIQNVVWRFFDGLKVFIQLIISFILLTQLNFWIGGFVILLAIPTFISNIWLHNAEYKFEKEHANTARRMEYFKDIFFEGALYEIKLYGLKQYLSKKYYDVWKGWYKGKKKINTVAAIQEICGLIILTISEVVVYVLSINQLISKTISVGDVGFYIKLLSDFRNNLTDLIWKIDDFIRNSKELEDVRRFIELKPLIEKGGTLIPSKKPKIEFRQVSFKYPDCETYVLKDCSFTIEKGEKVGLVGLNGSGKSTIVKLLLRFYDVTEGEILLDGKNIKDYDIVKLRAIFGVLFQDYVRYRFTARENITLSDIERMDDDEGIAMACKKSKIDSIIEKWDKGIDENLTRMFDPNGKELSVGQWQRFSLARAFFREADVVLLDEPSAALDPRAEHEIFEMFSSLSNKNSAVLISHRLSSITLTDKILVLESGKIIEEGSHKDLLNLQGRYAYLFNLQAQKYIQE